MDYRTKLYKQLARTIDAYRHCAGNLNLKEMTIVHRETIETLVKDLMPFGSGWDQGTKIDLDSSNLEKIVLYGSFHHMNQDGYYDGWTEHTITVRPSLSFDINLSISGPNRNDIKEYLHEIFHAALTCDINYVDSAWRRL